MSDSGGFADTVKYSTTEEDFIIRFSEIVKVFVRPLLERKYVHGSIAIKKTYRL